MCGRGALRRGMRRVRLAEVPCTGGEVCARSRSPAQGMEKCARGRDVMRRRGSSVRQVEVSCAGEGEGCTWLRCHAQEREA